ncbi:MAG: hydrolase [Deltaproteobacteria bacterium]|nr:hydrolase [Deltaproteobacteria bacterium]
MNEFVPARALGNPHLQTIYAPLFRRNAPLSLRRERLTTADGDFVDLDFLDGPAGSESAPRLVVLHGLEGSSEAGYVRGMLQHAKARGWPACALNFRSCSGEDNRRLRSYHSGDTGDLDLVVRTLVAREPARKLLLCGFSLGGNVTVKWLGEQGDAPPQQLLRACAISVPFDLSACADALDGPGFWAKIYRERFLKTLIAKAHEKAAGHADEVSAQRLSLARVDESRTLREFDDSWTAPVHGFSSAAEYYAKSSSVNFLPRVRVPLLLISAADDPFIPASAIPRALVPALPHVRLIETARGGHVGFVAGSIGAPVYWAEERAAAFLADFAGAVAGDSAGEVVGDSAGEVVGGPASRTIS